MSGPPSSSRHCWRPSPPPRSSSSRKRCKDAAGLVCTAQLLEPGRPEDRLQAGHDVIGLIRGGEVQLYAPQLVDVTRQLAPALTRALRAMAAGRPAVVNARIASMASPAGAYHLDAVDEWWQSHQGISDQAPALRTQAACR